MPDKILRGKFGPVVAGQNDTNLWVPIISVDLRDSLGASGRALGTDLTALIDTGAQNSVIDDGIVKKFNLPATRKNTIVMLGQRSNASGYNIYFVFSAIGLAYRTEVPSRPLRAGNSAFDVIVGWDILRHYTLQISKKSDTVLLVHEE